MKLIKHNTIKCPVCKKEVAYSGNPYRPFCSKACKGLDLIHWSDEGYRIEGQEDIQEHDRSEEF